ncbi:MAG TPA: choice-of-anchor tandem repeat GloVer-containing protein, partial [Candidatus Cybelea sp.]
AAAILAGCGSQTFRAAPALYSSSSSLTQPLGTYSSLYSFKGRPDGQLPTARLIGFNGMLYGTTSAGGSRCPLKGLKGCGTVFAISTTGRENVLYRFRWLPDGAEPLAELTAMKSLLYGTTNLGGTACKKTPSGCGTLFSITPSGTERVVYRFAGIPDGAHPQGSLINVNGTLYGTTYSGGTNCGGGRDGCGTVYSVGASGKERVLHRFTGKPDGLSPTGNLVFLNGKLYGTTRYGGECNSGTVFEITLSGTERVLYSPSCTGVDIVYPSGLVTVHGVLYGTSQEGGTRRHGALYSVTIRGAEHILQSFNGGNGSDPQGSLIAVNGALYGTTAGGGYGYGNVYAFSTSGRLQTLYRFKGVPDGSTPLAGLAYLNGTFYGTTNMGGSWCRYQYCQQGYGTVFRLSP